MDSVLVSAEVAVTESFYNQYLESGNNVEVIVDDNAEHGFVRDTLQILVFAPLFWRCVSAVQWPGRALWSAQLPELRQQL